MLPLCSDKMKLQTSKASSRAVTPSSSTSRMASSEPCPVLNPPQRGNKVYCLKAAAAVATESDSEKKAA